VAAQWFSPGAPAFDHLVNKNKGLPSAARHLSLGMKTAQFNATTA
jgi:hypothetical protein